MDFDRQSVSSMLCRVDSNLQQAQTHWQSEPMALDQSCAILIGRENRVEFCAVVIGLLKGLKI